MLHFLPAFLRIFLAGLLIAANTVLLTTPLLLVSLFKLALPFPSFRRACNRVLVWLAELWIAVNSGLIDLFTRTRFDVEGLHGLKPDGHYLVLANHRSWVDIAVLQKVFNRRIPLLRFFLKSQLIWIPFLGLAWWALDFPFMKRYSRKVLARHPELAGKDVLSTRRACEKFRGMPVSVMNFVEGTRFTAEKHARQDSPYRHLLRPKAGGVAFVLNAMDSSLHSIIDVTIVYPNGTPTMLDLMADRIGQVRVRIGERAIPAQFKGGDYENDKAFRVGFQRWLNGIWSEKDQQVSRLLGDG